MAVQSLREAFDGCERWDPMAFDAPLPVAEPEMPAPPTVSELEALAQQARDEGYAAGHAEGAAVAKREAQAVLVRLKALLDAAARPLDSMDDVTEQALARLATVVARRVLAHELSIAPARIVQAVQQAARALPAATRTLRVRLHPDDLAVLREHDVAEAHWELLGDPSLSRGDCLLESERSRLDARIETRLAAVIDAVLGGDAADDGDEDVTA